jgi:C4-dicarboxylate-binding protein DctP
MPKRLSRRSFAIASVAAIAAPAFVRSARAADEPLRLRLSLDTAPSHLRNVSMKDYLGKVEAASGARSRPRFSRAASSIPIWRWARR